MRNAAHRESRCPAIFGSRSERQVERARGHQRVLVEHLVEITHAKKQNRVAILLLRVEILPHRRRDARRGRGSEAGPGSGVGM